MNETMLSSAQSDALREIKSRVTERFRVVDFLLYGSAARGEAENESDLDLMIVISDPIPRLKRHEITDIVFDVNLQFDTNFSTLVVDRKSWESGLVSVLPLREEIMREGIRL
jgi:predicted nucleotidyltransferase